MRSTRKAEPLFIADGEEKDRDLERDPDRNPPEVVPIGRLLDTFKGGMSEQECLMYGIPLRRESYNDSQNFSIKTAMVSDGVVWHGIISLYKDAETNIIGLSLTTPLSEGALEKLFSALSGRAYKHVALGDDGPVIWMIRSSARSRRPQRSHPEHACPADGSERRSL